MTLLCATIILAACAGLEKTPSGTDVIDRSYTVTGFRWDGGGIVFVYAKAREKNGMTEVCAAFAPDDTDAFVSQFNSRVIDGANLQADGVTLTQGGGFMNRLSEPVKRAGPHANCVVTGREWEPRFDTNLVLRTGGGRLVD